MKRKLLILVPRFDGSAPIRVAQLNYRMIESRNSRLMRLRFSDLIPYLIAMRSEKFILHTHTLNCDLIGYLLKMMYRHNLIWISTIHNSIEDTVKYRFKGRMLIGNIWYRLLNRTDTIIVLSEFYRRHYAKKLQAPSKILYNTVLSEVLPEKKSLKNEFKLLCVGRLVKLKNFELVIKALSYLPNATLTIVGDGPEKDSLQRLAFDLNVNNRVDFIGYTINVDMYYKQCHALVIPSFTEGFPLVLSEACSYGVPVAAADIEQLRDINLISQYFNNLDELSLVSSLEKLKKDYDYLAEWTWNNYKENYSYNKVKVEYNKIIEGLS